MRDRGEGRLVFPSMSVRLFSDARGWHLSVESISTGSQNELRALALKDNKDRYSLPRKAWDNNRIRLVCGIVAILLFAGWYWRYGGPWKVEPTRVLPQADWTIAFAKSIADDQEITIH
jgi:hypothetical protein